VVLAACETAVGDFGTRESPDALVRAFLAGGAPRVVGSLWPVDDDDARRFFAAFYRVYVAGSSAEDALRHAAMEAGASERTHASIWAAFEAIGTAPDGSNGPPSGRSAAGKERS
jgi:CHAT domain-containing protein